jgi:hypothetical protein
VKLAVIQAYRFALDPTPEQDAVLRSHCGGQRFAFNWGLALVKANLEQRWAEKSYGIPAAELTPSLSWSAYDLRKLWNQVKDTTAPWWAENSKEAYSSGLANLATALSNWNASKTGKRRGPKVRFPRIKGKRHGMSCRFTTGAIGLLLLTAGMCGCPGSAPSAPTSRPGNSLGTSSTVGRVSARRRCRTGPDAGRCRSPYRSPAPIPRRRSPTPWSGSIWASRPWRCSRPVR